MRFASGALSQKKYPEGLIDSELLEQFLKPGII